jgi:hypothetical protein
LPVAFYKEFLGKVNLLIKEMLDEFRARNLDLRRINYGVINLLTKMLDANETKQYRPICLINVIFKIIIKILTRRLFAIVGPYIGPTQTAFIHGRFILDGVVVLDETLDDLKTRIESGIVIKLDFEKAYDKIQWSFLEEILIKKRFLRNVDNLD